MTPKPTGVFVQLPLSEDDCTLLIDASSFGAPDDSHDKALIAMRTREEQAKAMAIGIEGNEMPSERLIWLMAKELKEAERRAEQRVRAEIGRDSERLDWLEQNAKISKNIVPTTNPWRHAFTTALILKGSFGPDDPQHPMMAPLSVRIAIDEARDNAND